MPRRWGFQLLPIEMQILPFSALPAQTLGAGCRTGGPRGGDGAVGAGRGCWLQGRGAREMQHWGRIANLSTALTHIPGLCITHCPFFWPFSPPFSLFSSLNTHPCNFQATPGWPHGSGAEGTRWRARRAASTCQRINTPLSSALFTQSRCAGDGSSLSKRGPRRWVNIQYFI